jgi:TrmH family RNA methyltransferase
VEFVSVIWHQTRLAEMKIEPITSPHNPRFKRALQLHNSRSRRKQNQTLVVGSREVQRAIQSGVRVLEILVDADQVSNPGLAPILRELQSHPSDSAVPVFSLPHSLLEQLAYGDRETGVVAVVERPETELKNLPFPADWFPADCLVLVLESLEKPGNLGAIARSADASGCDALIVADPRTDIFHPNAIRSSVATVFSVPIATGTLVEVKQWLFDHQFRVYLASAEGQNNLYDLNLTGRTAIVLGSEAAGLNPDWQDASTSPLSIPMMGIGDSLNVSVTGSLVMYERLRQIGLRSKKGK